MGLPKLNASELGQPLSLIPTVKETLQLAAVSYKARRAWKSLGKAEELTFCVNRDRTWGGNSGGGGEGWGWVSRQEIV